MENCTLKQAYFIYKQIDICYCGYKMRRAKIHSLCQKRRDVADALVDLCKEAGNLYMKVAGLVTDTQKFHYNEDNRVSKKQAAVVIDKIKKNPVKQVSCKDCEYSPSCEAFITGKLIYQGWGSNDKEETI